MAGYELGNGWSLEGQVIDYGKGTLAVGAVTQEYKVSGWGVGTSYNVPINDQWAFNIAGHLNQNKFTTLVPSTGFSGNKTSSAFNLGLGFAYKFTDTLAATIQLDSSSAKDTANNSGGVRLISFGLRAKF